MAQVSNTHDSYDMNAIREDLSDVIYNISPTETPFLSSCAKTSASNTLHEWSTDTLRSSADNAHIEGDETTFEARTSVTRLGNRTQIFKNAVIVSDTDAGLNKAGRGKEMGYQILQVLSEQKLDMERACFLNQAAVTGSSTVARKMAGLGAWIATNTSKGASGADSSGDGSDARTDGTQRAFTQALFDDVMQSCWESGGNPDKVYLNAFQMTKALAFTGMNNQRSTIGASVGGTNAVINAVDVYVTPWGTVEFVPSRQCRARDVYVIESDKFAIATLRPTKQTELAKTGDAAKRQVVTEATLVSRNEAASGMVADLTTS
jgi:hypothetical protein